MYNLDSFKAQMKSLWKTKKKLDIQSAGPNLFITSFEEPCDMELILEGCPWLFRKHVVVFKRLSEEVEQNKIRLVRSPFWMRIGPCPLECKNKDIIQVARQSWWSHKI